MKHSLIFIFLAVACHFQGLSQSIIKGSAPAHADKEIQLYFYADLITFSTTKHASAIIGKDGSFELSSELPFTYLGLLKIESLNAHLYIEPDSIYDVYYPDADSLQKLRFVRDQFIQLDFRNAGDQSLNNLVMRFNQSHDNFMRENYHLLQHNKARQKADSFIVNTRKTFGDTGGEYFRDIVKYSLGSLRLTTNRNKQITYDEYFRQGPVKYQNDAYMDLFNQFYKHYLKMLSVSNVAGEQVLQAVNTKKSLALLDDLLANEKYLENKDIRELVILKGLFENYHNPEFKKDGIRVILRSIKEESAIAEHREIARNILEMVTKLAVGSKAPDFELSDKNGKRYRLSDFRGKYVYLDFWATWCIPCIKEMKLMPEFKEKYGNHVEFVSISIDNKITQMNKFLRKHKDYDWIFLHYGDQPEVKENYHAVAVPVYYLVDPDGYIIQSPALRPSGKIEATFQMILEKKGGKKKKNYSGPY